MYQKTKTGWCVIVAVLVGWSLNCAAYVARMSPLEYLVTRQQLVQQGWQNTSPFNPRIGYDPSPMLDFRPYPTRPKPEIRTREEIQDFGYWLWQSDAFYHYQYDLYDPFTTEWWGYEDHYWYWDSSQGYRHEWETYNVVDGLRTNDTGWSLTANTWGRKRLGSGTSQYSNYPHVSGYYCEYWDFFDGHWKLANLRNTSMPRFEIMVCFDLNSWPYRDHYWTALEAQTVQTFKASQVYVVAPSTTIDITPDYVTPNYQAQVKEFMPFETLYKEPYLNIDYMTYIVENDPAYENWVVAP